MLNSLLKILLGLLCSVTFAAEVTLLETPLDGFQARVDQIRSAKEEILLSTYVFVADQSGLALARELRDAAQRGVKVSIVADDFLTRARGNFPEPLVEYLVNSGVRFYYYNPPSKISLWYARFRLHAKFLLVDGKEMIIGGRNMADDYFPGNKERPWVDMDVHVTKDPSVSEAREKLVEMLEGPRVYERKVLRRQRLEKRLAIERSMDLAHSEMISKGNLTPLSEVPLGEDSLSSKDLNPREGTWRRSQVKVPDGHFVVDPFSNSRRGHTFARVIDLINSAKSSVDVVVAYFVPTKELKAALLAARARGVHIRLITNSQKTGNQKLVTYHNATFMPELTAMVDELWLYEGEENIHGKFFVVDRERVSVSSSNWNHRSQMGDVETSFDYLSPAHAERLLLRMDELRNHSKRSEMTEAPPRTLVGHCTAAFGRLAMGTLTRYLGWMTASQIGFSELKSRFDADENNLISY